LEQGGADTPQNKQTLCIEHHRIKTAAEAAHRCGGGV
jgi:hypothetical protein